MMTSNSDDLYTLYLKENYRPNMEDEPSIREPGYTYMYGGQLNDKFYMKPIVLPDDLELYDNEWKTSANAGGFLISSVPRNWLYRWKQR